eukprot:5039119-Prymnesium_polylepis.1
MWCRRSSDMRPGQFVRGLQLYIDVRWNEDRCDCDARDAGTREGRRGSGQHQQARAREGYVGGRHGTAKYWNNM